VVPTKPPTQRITGNFLFYIYIIHTVVLIRYIYLLEISVRHNNYCRSFSLYIRTTSFGLNRSSSGPQELNYVLCNIFVNCCVWRIFLTNEYKESFSQGKAAVAWSPTLNSVYCRCYVTFMYHADTLSYFQPASSF